MEAPRILKEPVNAEVYMSDGTSFEGTIYLRPARTLPPDLAPIEEYLAGTESLIPCRGEAGQLVFGKIAAAPRAMRDLRPESQRLHHRPCEPEELHKKVRGGHRLPG